MREAMCRLMVGLTLLVVCGCQASRALVGVPSVPHPSRRFAGTRLVFYGEAEGIGAELDRALATRFTADTGIQVDLVALPRNASEAFAVYQHLFEQKRRDADVLTLDVVWPAAFAPDLLDLGPSLGAAASDSFPVVLRNDTVDGRLVSVPWYVDAGLLYYRTDLLSKYGFSHPPETWTKLERMAKTIQAGERSADPSFHGFIWAGSAYENLTCTALEWQLTQGGGDLLDPTGRPEVDRPPVIAAWRRAAGWVGTIVPTQVTGLAQTDSSEFFREGHAAFMRNWTAAFNVAQSKGSVIVGRFGVAPLPHGEGPNRSHSILGGWQLGVSAYSRHPAAAMELIRYLTSPEVEMWRARVQGFPPALPALYQQPSLAVDRPLLQTMAAIMPDVALRPSRQARHRYNDLSLAFARGLVGVLQGKDAAFAASELQRELGALISGP